MKVATVVAAALLLCMVLPAPIQANFEKPKYCVGRDGKHYLRGEHYDYKNKETETCIRFTCVRKGKKLKMSKKKISCVEPPPNLTANVTALEASVKSLQASFLSLQTSVESILEMVIALQFRSSQLETNVTRNIDSININKDDISTNVASLATKCDASSCTTLQTTATDIESCLADITSSACPSPPSGKTSVAGGISGNTAVLTDKCDASTCSDIQTTVENLETNVTTNKDTININKDAISTNVASLATKCDASSCSSLQTSATDIESCLADITSSACPPPPSGKISVAGGISGNTAALADKCDASTCSDIQTNVQNLEGCCNISSTTPPPPTPTTTPTPTTPIGVIGDWSAWSDCTTTCGNATKTRTRTCRIAPCQPFDKEETVKCHLPPCGAIIVDKCFFEDTKITFHDLGHNKYAQDEKPDWILSDKGRTLKSFLNTRPSAGLTNLGNISNPVSFSGRVFSTSTDNDVMGMVFGFWNETNFFIVASARDGGPTNWYVGRLHATCGQNCSNYTTISDAIWYPQRHPEDITVLATGSSAWQEKEKYNFTVCFNPSKLLLNVNVLNVTVEDEAEPVLQTGTISAKTNDSEVDEISRGGGFIGVYVDSQADTTWDNLDCHDCDLDKSGTIVCSNGSTELSTAPGGDMTLCKDVTSKTCEMDFESLCPAGWHLCSVKEFNNRNSEWNYNWKTNIYNANRPLGVIYCRGEGAGGGHFTIQNIDTLNQDEIFNCWYGSTRDGCARYGKECNEGSSSALCCSPRSSCGNGIVDHLEEECDDGNEVETDSCLSSCTWRIPSNHGLSGTGCR